MGNELSRADPRPGPLRPFYFYVVVWGASYVDSLVNFCIPSLLAPGNIPSLDRTGSKLLVVAPAEDWDRLRGSPIASALQSHVELVHIELPARKPEASVYDHMSLGHGLATQAAFAARAYGVMLMPDMILSDGSIAAVKRHAERGVQVVLTVALRYGEEPFFEHLGKLGIADAASRFGDEARPLRVTGRQLAYAGVNGFHP